MSINIVKKGTWLYDGTVVKLVDIIAFEYDWWYEMAKTDGAFEPEEEPEPVGKEGYLYYVRFQRALETGTPTWVDSAGYPELEEAMIQAESRVAGSITWKP